MNHNYSLNYLYTLIAVLTVGNIVIKQLLINRKKILFTIIVILFY